MKQRGPLLLAGLFVLAFYPVWAQLVGVWWRMDQYSHGFLVVPVSLWLVWRQRHQLPSLANGGSIPGLAIALPALCSYLFGILAGSRTLSSLSMILFIWGAVHYLFGVRLLRRVSFPIVFLIFMVPVPAPIYAMATIPLQLLVSRISVWLGSLAGVPLLLEGNLIRLPEQALQVVDACSGLRSMMTLLALAALVWHLTLRSRVNGAVLMLAAVPVAMTVNIVRVTLMILGLWHLNLDLTDGILHTILGISVNLLALLMIFILRRILSRWEPVSPDA
jgi:exosortase